MAEITYRIPSKAVQYGYVEVTRNWSDDEPTDPEMLAAAYINYVYAFQKEEQAAIERLKDVPQKPSAAPQGAEQRTVQEVMSDEDVDSLAEAQAILDKELGGVIEVEENDNIPMDRAAQAAPWDAKVEAKPKPWQSDGW